MISKVDARNSAEAYLDTYIRPRFSHDIVIVECAIEERDDCWIFPYDGRARVERDDTSEIMAGNTPIQVNKETGFADFAR